VIYGYARVSTTGQTLDAQLKQLQAEGCAKIYREKQSGAPTGASQARMFSSLRSKSDELKFPISYATFASTTNLHCPESRVEADCNDAG
jgi:Resolvase, N terminal domain